MRNVGFISIINSIINSKLMVEENDKIPDWYAKENIYRTEIKIKNSAVTMCFDDCVNNFEDDTLTKEEKQCLISCG